MVDHEPPPGATFSLHYEDEEGFQLARKTARPRKIDVTLANFVDVNSSKSLESQKERKMRNKQKVVKCCEDFKP